MDSANETPAITMNKPIIADMLPHKGIMLLPDEVQVFPEENRAIGTMKVPDNEIMRGHFGILPGVLQVEFSYQVLAVLIAKQHPKLAGVAAGIQNVQFDVMAKVGDTITADVTITDENIIREKKGDVTAKAAVQQISDDTTKSVMDLKATLMTQRAFERLTRPTDPAYKQALRDEQGNTLSA